METKKQKIVRELKIDEDYVNWIILYEYDEEDFSQEGYPTKTVIVPYVVNKDKTKIKDLRTGKIYDYKQKEELNEDSFKALNEVEYKGVCCEVLSIVEDSSFFRGYGIEEGSFTYYQGTNNFRYEVFQNLEPRRCQSGSKKTRFVKPSVLSGLCKDFLFSPLKYKTSISSNYYNGFPKYLSRQDVVKIASSVEKTLSKVYKKSAKQEKIEQQIEMAERGYAINKKENEVEVDMREF